MKICKNFDAFLEKYIVKLLVQDLKLKKNKK